MSGNQRLEPETILSYTNLRPGEPYDNERLDQALRDLLATELFADVQIAGARHRQSGHPGPRESGHQPHHPRGQQAHQGRQDHAGDPARAAPDLHPQPRPAPTSPGSSSSTAARAASPPASSRKIVQLDQNRVDVVFEINEGPKSTVRRINIIGNEHFGDGHLIGEMATREHVWYNIFSSRDTYDPDRLAYDQQKLRQFYLTQGYADFRVVSAVAELTPDQRDFIITYVVEEGAALQVRRCRRSKARSAISAREQLRANAADARRPLVQCQAGRGHGRPAERARRPVRLRLRRRPPATSTATANT